MIGSSASACATVATGSRSSDGLKAPQPTGRQHVDAPSRMAADIRFKEVGVRRGVSAAMPKANADTTAAYHR
jgi:hypothetical protein